MAKDDKKAKASPAPKAEVAAAKKKEETAPTDKTSSGAEPIKAESGDAGAAAPKGYSRGEGQKPVTQAYKDNWNAIYGKEKKKKRLSRSTPSVAFTRDRQTAFCWPLPS
ncbi:MAG: hypothetical protein ACREB8_11775 [Pseudolabrys sp.]